MWERMACAKPGKKKEWWAVAFFRANLRGGECMSHVCACGCERLCVRGRARFLEDRRDPGRLRLKEHT